MLFYTATMRQLCSDTASHRGASMEVGLYCSLQSTDWVFNCNLYAPHWFVFFPAQFLFLIVVPVNLKVVQIRAALSLTPTKRCSPKMSVKYEKACTICTQVCFGFGSIDYGCAMNAKFTVRLFFFVCLLLGRGLVAGASTTQCCHLRAVWNQVQRSRMGKRRRW